MSFDCSEMRVKANLWPLNIFVGDICQGTRRSIPQMNGISIGLGNDIYVARNHFSGIGIQVLNERGGNIGGIQVGLVNNTNGDMTGIQTGYIFNGAKKDMIGIQAGIWNFARNMTGLQIAIFNQADKDMKGVQIGAVNYAGGEMQATFGLVNLSERCNFNVATPIWGGLCLFGRDENVYAPSADHD